MKQRLVQLGVTDRHALAAARARVGGEAALTSLLLRRSPARLAVSELVVLSTCERLELYAQASTVEAGSLAALLASHCPEAALQHRLGEAAAAHLFAVAAGLESRLAGEPQILGQVSRAPERTGCRAGLVHALFGEAVASGRETRAESGLERVAKSCVDLAIEHARRVVRAGAPAAVIGSGALAVELAARLGGLGVPTTIVARHPAHAAGLLPADSAIVPLEELGRLAPKVGLIIAATSSSSPVVELRHLEDSVSPLALIDLGMPANISRDVLRHLSVTLATIEELLAGYVRPREVLARAAAMSNARAGAWSRRRLREEPTATVALRSTVA